MASLDPATGILIQTPEDVYTFATITALGFTVIDSWEWEFVPVGSANTDVVPKNFSFTETSLTLKVDYHSNEDLFPLKMVQYVDRHTTLHTVDNFDELPDPADSPDLVKVVTDGRNMQMWNLEVSVSGTSDEGIVTVSETYQVIIEANYNGARDRLVQEVNNRRFF